MSERIVYTLHALERLKQRKISLEAVRSCLIDPDRVVQEDNTKRAVKRVSDRALVVVYREEGQEDHRNNGLSIVQSRQIPQKMSLAR